MKRLSLAAAIPALTLGLVALPPAVQATGQASQGAATDQLAPAPGEQATRNDATTGNAAPAAQDRDGTAVGKKHPPTASMDRATPPDKSPRDAATTKHPPTGSMDSAAPEQKSPPAAERSSATRDDTSTAPRQ